MLYPLLRRLLFLLDAESAHDLAAGAMARAQELRPLLRAIEARHRPPAAAARRFLGMTCRSPVGIAAGFDKNAEMLPFLVALGFGFIEVGTVTLRAQPGNPRPRMFRHPEASAIVNRMGFNNDGAAAVAERLARWRAARPDSPPIFVNVGKNRDVDLDDAAGAYAACYAAVAPYADACVINVSSPNTPGLRTLQEPERLRRIIDAVRAEGPRRPLLVKIAPDLDDAALAGICSVCTEAADGMICTNTTIERLAGQREEGGLSGAPLRERSTRVLERVRQFAGHDFPLIGVGGIFTAADAREKLAAGAALVQLYTGFIYEGPSLPARLARELAMA